MLDAANWVKEQLSWIGPGLIIIVCIIVYASITRGYRGFLQAIKDITYTKWSFLGFFIFVVVAFYFLNRLLEKVGWA